MAALHEACASGRVPAQVGVVIASTESSPALARAAELGLQTAVVPGGLDYGGRLFAAPKGCDDVCVAGDLRLLPVEVARAFPCPVLDVHHARFSKLCRKCA